MKTNQKGGVNTILLIIILLAIAVGAYVYLQKDKEVEPILDVEVSEGQPISEVVKFEDAFAN